MTEIEKMKKYIERTGISHETKRRYQIDIVEAFELAGQAYSADDVPLSVISLVFDYGMAKGYRAAKSEVRA